jgi:hypothetical protein
LQVDAADTAEANQANSKFSAQAPSIKVATAYIITIIITTMYILKLGRRNAQKGWRWRDRD